MGLWLSSKHPEANRDQVGGGGVGTHRCPYEKKSLDREKDFLSRRQYQVPRKQS